MEPLKSQKRTDWAAVIPEQIPHDIAPEDEQIFLSITSTALSEGQRQRITTAARTFARQQSVLAVHWHPEFIPMELIKQRIDGTFPARENELIIPTQHNEIETYNGYCGVEIDCYSGGFNQKVQLLLHFPESKLDRTGLLRSMLAHTFKYRSSQLFEFMHTITEPVSDRLDLAAKETGANDALIRFTQVYVRKIAELLDRHAGTMTPAMIKNKILPNFFDALRPQYGAALIDRVQTFLRAVKTIVKANFPLQYFYKTEEVVEEARSFGAGIIVPHPEQFWPILLADYDIDGLEVWNPQSRKYTDFLISVIDRKNNQCVVPEKRLLVFMGDDTHMAEKIRDPQVQDPEKARREIGHQPAWDDYSIRKTLIEAGIDRKTVIQEYKARLGN
jgi:hypothetical protein